jgi:hypothetical protein
MASGPAGTGWTYFADNLNAIFDDDVKRGNLGNDFKQKHGSNGNGMLEAPLRINLGILLIEVSFLKAPRLDNS